MTHDSDNPKPRLRQPGIFATRDSDNLADTRASPSISVDKWPDLTTRDSDNPNDKAMVRCLHLTHELGVRDQAVLDVLDPVPRTELRHTIDAREDVIVPEHLQGFIERGNGIADAPVLQEPAIAPNRGVQALVGLDEAGVGLIVRQSLVQPPRELGAMSHHPGVVELPVGALNDRLGNKDWASRVSLVIPCGGSCRRTDSLLGD